MSGLSGLVQIPASAAHAATLAALRRMLAYGSPLMAEERHAAYELLHAVVAEMAADPTLIDRLEARCVAARRGG